MTACGRRPDCVASPLDTWAGTFKGCCGRLEPAFFQTALGHGRTLPRWTFPSGGESGPAWGGWRGCAWRAAVGGVDPPPHTRKVQRPCFTRGQTLAPRSPLQAGASPRRRCLLASFAPLLGPLCATLGFKVTLESNTSATSRSGAAGAQRESK